jgi:peptidoglycan/LPS O-acetylase OafA/YrhL
MLVFLFHSWEFSGRPRIPILTDIVGQNTRPDLFIVITGFVLFLPFARDMDRIHRFQTGEYLRRRLRRIVLPYWAALALALALPLALKAAYALLGKTTNPTPAPDWGDVLAHVTFTHMFFPEYWDGINGSLWTMSLEMQLYLLFPLLILVAARWGMWSLALAVTSSFAYRIAVEILVDGPGFPDQFLWGATAIGRLMEFAAGMAAAVLAMRLRKSFTALNALLTLIVFVGSYIVATASPWSSSAFPVRDTALALGFGSLVILAIGNRWVEAAFAWSPFSSLGYRAYSLFLVHQPVAWYTAEFFKKELGLQEGLVLLLLMWTVGFAAVWLVGSAFFRLIEAPCIRWSRAAKSPYNSRPSVDPTPA